MLMDLLHGFEVLSTTEETLFNSRNVSRLVQNNPILVVFCIIFTQILFKFFELNSECFAKYVMHFVRTFSIMRAYGVRHIAIEEVQNYRKIV